MKMVYLEVTSPRSESCEITWVEGQQRRAAKSRSLLTKLIYIIEPQVDESPASARDVIEQSLMTQLQHWTESTTQLQRLSTPVCAGREEDSIAAISGGGGGRALSVVVIAAAAT